MTLTYDIDLPTLNEYIAQERGNKITASSAKKKYTNWVRVLTLNQTRERLTGLYDLTLTWYRKDNKHDADNVYFGIKFILDGMVSANLIPGDGRKYIQNISHQIITSNIKKNYVEVKLLET